MARMKRLQPHMVCKRPRCDGVALRVRDLSGVSYRSEDRAVASDLDRSTLRYRPHCGVVRHGEVVLMRLGDGPEGGVSGLNRQLRVRPRGAIESAHSERGTLHRDD